MNHFMPNIQNAIHLECSCESLFCTASIAHRVSDDIPAIRSLFSSSEWSLQALFPASCALSIISSEYCVKPSTSRMLGTILLRKAKFPAQLLVEIARIGQVIFRPARPRAPLWLLAFVRFLLHLLYSRPNRLILSSSSSLQFR